MIEEKEIENNKLFLCLLSGILIVSFCALAYGDPVNLRFIFQVLQMLRETTACSEGFLTRHEGKINVTAEYIVDGCND